MIHALKANETYLESAKKLLFWSWQWSDSSGSATDGSFDVGLGKTLRIGDFPSLDQSAHVYLYWPPGPFLATQYDKEPGGAGFEVRSGGESSQRAWPSSARWLGTAWFKSDKISKKKMKSILDQVWLKWMPARMSAKTATT